MFDNQTKFAWAIPQLSKIVKIAQAFKSLI